MKTSKFAFVRREAMWGWLPRLMMTVLWLALATTALTQTSVFVPGTASGGFGYPNDGFIVPLVPALTVSGPGTITVTYVSGTVIWAVGLTAGPKSVYWQSGGPNGCQLPLQASRGISHDTAPNMAALIGAFVPESRAQKAGFSPVDGTKHMTPVGIMPGTVFFIGVSRTITVTEAGTLFLGINDCITNDNGGGFNVTVSTP